ncbi:hypothetical protein [Shewanella violacea]|uniref:Uncharacterized protein n=1 Tax=Shewanella violacea (strain JCM 10179 / CIP 106290 / LMG 19151 / DSS12) TaxID=637905 RepID=D4ZMC0_SHEVD|nr:hypothetical protein [Shewanella violacea]BAJ02819.1 hypothetical protein SVI_2848 [Shewanella violacea DSS12]
MKTFTRNGLSAALLITTMAATFGASAATTDEAQASLLWRGVVQVNVSTTDMILTGLNSATEISSGFLNNVTSHATFGSTPIIVEAHSYDTTDPKNPQVGGLMAKDSVNWEILGGDIYAPGTTVSLAEVPKSMEFFVGGVSKPQNATFTDATNALSITVSNATPITDEIDTNTDIQVKAIILASTVV